MDKIRLAVHFGSGGVLVLRAFVAFFFFHAPCASSVPSLSVPRLASAFCFRPRFVLRLLVSLRFPCPARPSPSSSALALSSVIKRGYFSVGLLKLTFLRPGEMLKIDARGVKNPQKSGVFLSWAILSFAKLTVCGARTKLYWAVLGTGDALASSW